MLPVNHVLLNQNVKENLNRTLQKLANLQGRKTAWIRSDLTIVNSTCISRFFWTIFAKHFDWARKFFYRIDLETSRRKLSDLQTIVFNFNDESLKLNYLNAISKFNKVAFNHQISRESISKLIDPVHHESVKEKTDRLFADLAVETEKLMRNIEHLPFIFGEHRFDDVLCPKHTAISYTKNPLDYIHANRVDFPKGKSFIAAQVNLRHDKFWKAAILHTNLIVDLTTPRDSIVYYPGLNQTYVTDDVKITCAGEEDIAAHFKLSTYSVTTEDGVKKNIKRIHYNNWNDYSDTALDELITLINLVEKHTDEGISPMVHCRAGVGRTGTFMAACHLKHLKTESPLDSEKLLVDTILFGREARGALFVQSKEQLTLLIKYSDYLLRN